MLVRRTHIARRLWLDTAEAEDKPNRDYAPVRLLALGLALLLQPTDTIGEALVLAVHGSEFLKDAGRRAVKPHDDRGQHLHVVTKRVKLIDDPFLLPGEEFEADRFIGHRDLSSVGGAHSRPLPLI